MVLNETTLFVETGLSESESVEQQGTYLMITERHFCQLSIKPMLWVLIIPPAFMPTGI